MMSNRIMAIKTITKVTNDYCEGDRVTVHYQDGTKHTFKSVYKVSLVQGDKHLIEVFFEKEQQVVIDDDIVENIKSQHEVVIPKHYVKHYIVHSNDGVAKTERKVKVL